MNKIGLFAGVLVAAILALTFLAKRVAGKLPLYLWSLVLVSSIPAIQALTGHPSEWIFPGNFVTGAIPLRLDALSAWFILIINFIFLTTPYLYESGGVTTNPIHIGMGSTVVAPKIKTSNVNGVIPVAPGEIIHRISFLFLYASMIALCVIQNSLVFLIAWEIMTLSAFLTIIHDYKKQEVLKAGLNFLIQSHVSVVFLMAGFILAAVKTGSYDFHALGQVEQMGQMGQEGQLASCPSIVVSTIIFVFLLIGFGIKAGFVPFHTWLPHAHPAAPAHISGIMSGVIIKIGIFGILRMIMLIPVDYTTVGYWLLAVSLLTGIYGVMLAIIQHNLKKLLAYHSIENIGIIGLGIALGCIGLGNGNSLLASVGFAGALLHTLNHALFKSLLFFTAGNVYKATHTMNIEHLGGVMKKMPQTAILFLISAIAICGIPPFNGFVSEFLIYTGLYAWLQEAALAQLVAIIFVILGLVLIGGLALFCFTKAFGIVFLGSPRKELNHEVKEAPFTQLIPLYLISALLVMIGSFPQLFLNLLNAPVSLFTQKVAFPEPPVFYDTIAIVCPIAWSAWGVIGVSLVLWGIRRIAQRREKIFERKLPISNSKYPISNTEYPISSEKSEILALSEAEGVHPKSEISPTWSCGYVAPNPKLQYTAGSFARTYSQLFRGIFHITKKEQKPEGIFPSGGHYASHSGDKLENTLVTKPVNALYNLMCCLNFLQTGRLQVYILFGIIFILAIIGLQFLPDWFPGIQEFLNGK